MSNCVYLVFSHMLKRINKGINRGLLNRRVGGVLRAIVDKRFSNFIVETLVGGWLVRHREQEDLCFHVWWDKFDDRLALMIRHGYNIGFMWWVEYEVRERLAAKLGLDQFDEGIGKSETLSVFYETYSDYLRGVYGPDWIKGKVDELLGWIGDLPADVVVMLGDLFV